jgi:hypothetical protein
MMTEKERNEKWGKSKRYSFNNAYVYLSFLSCRLLSHSTYLVVPHSSGVIALSNSPLGLERAGHNSRSHLKITRFETDMVLVGWLVVCGAELL